MALTVAQDDPRPVLSTTWTSADVADDSCAFSGTGLYRFESPTGARTAFVASTPVCSSLDPHPCLSGACFGCTDQAAGSSSLSASAATAVACTLPGL